MKRRRLEAVPEPPSEPVKRPPPPGPGVFTGLAEEPVPYPAKDRDARHLRSI